MPPSAVSCVHRPAAFSIIFDHRIASHLVFSPPLFSVACARPSARLRRVRSLTFTPSPRSLTFRRHGLLRDLAWRLHLRTDRRTDGRTNLVHAAHQRALSQFRPHLISSADDFPDDFPDRSMGEGLRGALQALRRH